MLKECLHLLFCCSSCQGPRKLCGCRVTDKRWLCLQGRGSGVNFALPADLVVDIVPKLIVYGNASGKGMG